MDAGYELEGELEDEFAKAECENVVVLEDDEVYLKGNASEMMMGEDGMDEDDAVEEEDVLHVDGTVWKEELVVRSDDGDVVLRELSAELGELDVVMEGVNDAVM